MLMKIAKNTIDEVIDTLELMIDDELCKPMNPLTKVLNYEHAIGKYHGIIRTYYLMDLKSENYNDYLEVATYRKAEIESLMKKYNDELITPLYRTV